MKIGEVINGPIACDGHNGIVDEVVFMGKTKDGHEVYRCNECRQEIERQIQLLQPGVDKPGKSVVESGGRRKDGTQQQKESTSMSDKAETKVSETKASKTKAPVGLKSGQSVSVEVTKDKDISDGIRVKADRAGNDVFGSLYLTSKIAGKHTKFKITVEPID
jgi:hypothetical protein